MSVRRGATGLSGVLVVDKPAGMTSHDVVATLRRGTGEHRIGHAGTLDPMATGLLLVLVGVATRLERYLSGLDKRYEARIAFGETTDTLDAEGTVTARADVPARVLDPGFATAVLAGYLGPSAQVPPAYSAIKTDGVASHRRARAGQTVALEARPIVVHEAELRAVDPVALTWDVALRVSKGTYIRSLARDIGETAGTVAHLTALRRTGAGPIGPEAMLPLSELTTSADAGRIERHFVDPVPLLGLRALDVAAADVTDGRPLPVPADADEPGAAYAAVDADRLLAVYRLRDGLLRAETVFPGGIPR